MMKNPRSPGGRGPQILKLLVEHGPISIRGLEQIVQPKIHRRKLRVALHRLERKGLLFKIQPKIFGGSGVFYQVTRCPKKWKVVAKTISCGESDFEKSLVVPREMLHSEYCAIWTEFLKRQFPQAWIIRDHAIKTHATAKDILAIKGEPQDPCPDILIVFNKDVEAKRVSVAIEVERFCKSNDRLEFKLRKYTNEAFLDGIIYVCESDEIVRKLARVYYGRVIKRAAKVNNYGNNFFLSRSDIECNNNSALKFMNAMGDKVDLLEWILTLNSKNLYSRFDSNFYVGPPGTPHFVGAENHGNLETVS